MKEEKVSYSGGIGFTGLLTILFIGLKLTGYIDWSWLWVLSPLWIPFAIFLLILAVTGFFALFLSMFVVVVDLFKGKRK